MHTKPLVARRLPTDLTPACGAAKLPVMKTIVCLVVIVAVLPSGLYAQAPKPKDPVGPEAAAVPAVPAEVMDLARAAKDQFERGDYRAAEKTYDQALALAPDNLYLLSNKGIVLFRLQKYKLAEAVLKRAIAVAPQDDFAHCTLGIVEYQQGKLDEAINELTKALAINPKNADAHNYLGIVASQKGWQGTALKELETATAVEPSFGRLNFDGPNYDGPAYRAPFWIGDFSTPLERSRFRIPSGKYEPLRPIRDPIVK